MIAKERLPGRLSSTSSSRPLVRIADSDPMHRAGVPLDVCAADTFGAIANPPMDARVFGHRDGRDDRSLAGPRDATAKQRPSSSSSSPAPAGGDRLREFAIGGTRRGIGSIGIRSRSGSLFLRKCARNRRGTGARLHVRLLVLAGNGTRSRTMPVRDRRLRHTSSRPSIFLRTTVYTASHASPPTDRPCVRWCVQYLQ